MIKSRAKFASLQRGYTLLEILIVIGIIGIMAVTFYPNIMSTLETREFENAARDVQSTLQRAKFMAVKTKLNHRVRFVNEANRWVFFIEREDNPNQWNLMHGFIKKTISPKFKVNVNLPSQAVAFSPLGVILNFDSQQNSVTMKSFELESYDQPDQRIIYVFAGGSTQYIKS